MDTLEERALYAHLEKDRRTSALADRARRENVQIEQLIEELGAIPREADTRFRQRTQLLNQRLRRHVDWEETELFRVASRLFPREAALRLGERIAAEKEELQRNLAA